MLWNEMIGEHVEVEVTTAEREFDRKLVRRRTYVLRRRTWLWRPLALLGAVLVVWQVTSWEPVPLLLYLGVAALVPWVVDV